MVHLFTKMLCFVCLGLTTHARAETTTGQYFRNVIHRKRANVGQAAAANLDPVDQCDAALSGGAFKTEAKAMRVFNEELPKIFGREWVEKQSWYQLMNFFAMPAVDRESPALFMTFFGPPNTWKSTLANYTLATLGGQSRAEFTNASPVSSQAGSTRRPLVFVPKSEPGEAPDNLSEVIMADVKARYSNPQLFDADDDLAAQGEPGMVEVAGLPKTGNIVIVDAPDPLSGAINSDDPALKKQAERAIVPADVLVIMLDPSNYGRQDTKDTLHKIFEKYGRKRSIIVWRGLGDGVAGEEIRRYTREFASEVYGTDPSVMPEAVRGIYWTAENAAVRDGHEFPVLNPLSGYQSYPELLTEMSATAEEVKRYSIRDALSRIESDVTDLVKLELRQRYAGRIYREAVERIIETIAHRAQTGFPPGQDRSDIRDLFFTATQYPGSAKLRRFIDGIKDAFRTVGSKFSNKGAKTVTREVYITRRLELTRALMQQMRAQLKAAEVSVRPKPIRVLPTGHEYAGGYLEMMARGYGAFFDQTFDVNFGAEADAGNEGSVHLRLPPMSDLSADAREHLLKALDFNPEKLNAALVERLELLDKSASAPIRKTLRQLEFTAANALETNPEYQRIDAEIKRADRELSQIFQKNVTGKRARAFKNWDVAALGSFTGGIGSLLYAGIFTPASLGLVVGGVGLSTYIQTQNDRARETELSRLLDVYFNERQAQETSHFLNEVFADLNEHLKPKFDEKVTALDNVKEALRLTTTDLVFPSDFEPTYQVLDDPATDEKTIANRVIRSINWTKRRLGMATK